MLLQCGTVPAAARPQLTPLLHVPTAYPTLAKSLFTPRILIPSHPLPPRCGCHFASHQPPIELNHAPRCRGAAPWTARRGPRGGLRRRPPLRRCHRCRARFDSRAHLGGDFRVRSFNAAGGLGEVFCSCSTPKRFGRCFRGGSRMTCSRFWS